MAHRIKNKLRSRLTVDNLDILLRIQLTVCDYRTTSLDGAFQNWLDNNTSGRYNIGLPSSSNSRLQAETNYVSQQYPRELFEI